MASSKMSKGDSNRCPGRYEWKEVRREECYSTFTKDLFSQNGFHVLSPGASAKVHQVISTQDHVARSKCLSLVRWQLLQSAWRTLTALGAIFMRDTCPDLALLGQDDASRPKCRHAKWPDWCYFAKKNPAPTLSSVSRQWLWPRTVLKKPARKSWAPCCWCFLCMMSWLLARHYVR